MSIRLKDIDKTQSTIRVMRKGSKERDVHSGVVTRRAMTDYLERRGGLETDYLFVTEHGEPMQARIAQEQIARYGVSAGIQGIRVSPHTLGHTFAKNWIANGGDVFSLQKMLGHTTMEMVRRYLDLANSDVAKAHRASSPAERTLGNLVKNEQRHSKKCLDQVYSLIKC